MTSKLFIMNGREEYAEYACQEGFLTGGVLDGLAGDSHGYDDVAYIRDARMRYGHAAGQKRRTRDLTVHHRFQHCVRVYEILLTRQVQHQLTDNTVFAIFFEWRDDQLGC